MLIDWFTVGAQTINFVILVWLLKRFLFGPITQTIERRQSNINMALSEASATKLEAEKRYLELEEQRAELEQMRDRLINEATAAAQSERERLLAEAADSAEVLRKNRLDTLRDQEEKLHQALRERAQQEAVSIAQDILLKLSEVDLDIQTVNVFLKRLDSLDNTSLQTLLQALEDSDNAVEVRSSHHLPEKARKRLEGGVEEKLSRTLQWSYRIESSLLTGLELIAEGYKIAWSGSELLDQIQNAAREFHSGGSL